MSNVMKSRLPRKKNVATIDAFISGAEKKTDENIITNKKQALPWEEQGVREDVTKVYNLRLSEPYFLKLKYIADHTPNSMQKFCLNALQEAIDAEMSVLLK